MNRSTKTWDLEKIQIPTTVVNFKFCQKLAKDVSSVPEDIQHNSALLYVALNVQLNVVRDITNDCMSVVDVFLSILRDKGVIAYIKTCEDLASVLVRNDEIPFELSDLAFAIHTYSLKDRLTMLRFLKRVQIADSKRAENTLDKFWSNQEHLKDFWAQRGFDIRLEVCQLSDLDNHFQNICLAMRHAMDVNKNLVFKLDFGENARALVAMNYRDWAENNAYTPSFNLLQLSGKAPYLYRRVEEILAEILAPYADLPSAVELGKFGSGATLETHINRRGKTLREKWGHLATNSTVASYWAPYAPSCKQEMHVTYREDYVFEYSDEVGGLDFLDTVPKNFDSDRVICYSTTGRAWVAQGIREKLLICMKASKYWDLFNIEDQTKNRRLASTNGFATIDSSAASDAIVRFHMSLFPEAVREDILRWCAYGFVNDKRQLYSCCMMGFAPTFNILSILELAMTIVGVEYCYFWMSSTDKRKYSRYRSKIAIEGDDIVVHSAFAPTVVDTLKTFGFTVNESKTFIGTKYTESCGGEYWDGLSVKPDLLPRKDLLGLESLPTLVALQRDVSHYPIACRFLTSMIRFYCPEMTFSPTGDYTDLWGPFASGKRVLAPFDTTHTFEWCSDISTLHVNGLHESANGTLRPIASWKPSTAESLARAREIREEHSLLSHVTLSAATPTAGSDPLTESLLYAQYLAYGPYYASEVDRLLRISTSRRRIPNLLSCDTIYTTTKY